MDDESENLHWHALNYRTAAPQHADEMWQTLVACVERKVAAERERMSDVAQRRSAETAARIYAEMDASVAAERERCAKVCDGYAKHMLSVYEAKGQKSALDEATGAVACASGIRA